MNKVTRYLVIILVIVSIFIFAIPKSNTAFASPNCGGQACDCYIPYHGRGGHVWEGYIMPGPNGQMMCNVTWRSGCVDFC